MAEQVEAILDHMVPSLRDFLDRGVFTEPEIHAIVTRRRESEYLIRRRVCRKADFARYIEAEKNLETLRSLRCKRLLRSSKDKAKEKSNTTGASSFRPSVMADASIVQHIHYLYSRAKRKWKEDLTWHLQHVDFAKSVKSFQMLGKIYAEALQIHPRCVHLWVEAASHEYFGYIVNSNNNGMSGGGSIRNARVLLQRGLRINPTSGDLWLQYFILEMHYVQKLRGRRNILQPQKEDEMNTSSIMSEDQDLLHGDLLPLIIYKNAVKAIPKDISLRLRFLDACNQFPDSDSVVKEILSSLEDECGDLVETWITRATHLLNFHKVSLTAEFALEDGEEQNESRKRKSKQTRLDTSVDWNIVEPKLVELLQHATDRINSDDIYIHAIRLLLNVIKGSERDKLISFVDTLFCKASERGLVSSALLLQYTDWLCTLDQLPKVYQLFSTYLLMEKRLSDAQLWIQWAEVSAKLLTSTETESQAIYSPEYILQSALDLIPMHDKGHFDVALNHFIRQIHLSKESKRMNNNTLIQLFDKLLLLSAQSVRSTTEDDRSSKMLDVCCTFLRHALSLDDSDFIRGIYGRLFYSSSFLKHLKVQDQDSIDKISFLFEATITFERNCAKKNKNGKDRSQRIVDTLVGFFEEQGLEKVAKVYKNQFIN